MKDALQLTCYFIECAVSWSCLLSVFSVRPPSFPVNRLLNWSRLRGARRAPLRSLWRMSRRSLERGSRNTHEAGPSCCYILGQGAPARVSLSGTNPRSRNQTRTLRCDVCDLTVTSRSWLWSTASLSLERALPALTSVRFPHRGRLDSRARTTVRRRPTSGVAHRFFPWLQ